MRRLALVAALAGALVAAGAMVAAVEPAPAGPSLEDALRAQLASERTGHERLANRLRREVRRGRARLARARRALAETAPLVPARLRSIASCESGMRPGAVSAGGTYRGAYQFDRSTWASVGGTGDPAAASMAEQTYRAELLYRRRGAQPWPVCGRR